MKMNILRAIMNKPQGEKRSEMNSSLFSAVMNSYRSEEITNLQLSAVFRSIEILSDSVANLPILSENYHDLFYNVLNINKFQWLKLIVRNIIINGNAFTYIQTDEKGEPKKLIYLNPSDVVINYNITDNRLYYVVANHLGIGTVYPEKMLHFRKITTNGVEGISLLSYAQKTLNLSKLTEQAANDYFDTSNFKGFLSTESQLSPERQSQIENNFSMFMRNRSAAVLSGGLTFTELKQDSAKDQELRENREYQVEEIARFFGIPKDLLLGNSSPHGLEQSQQEFFVRTLQGYIVTIEEECERKLFDKIDLDETAMMRMTKKDQAEYLTKLQMGGIITINEAREALGYEPVEGGDKNILAYTSVEDNKIN